MINKNMKQIEIEQKWSNKYKQYFGISSTNKHPKSDKLFKIGNYWYRPDKDILIHKDVVDDYIEKCNKAYKKHRQEHYINKHNIRRTEEQETNSAWKEILKNKNNY